MAKAKTPSPSGAYEIIEEAVFFLRRSGVRLLLPYYVGTLPFIMGFLYFWGDMSQGAYAEAYLAPASLGLAFLFIWMKWCQSVFTRRIVIQLTGKEPDAQRRIPGIRDMAFQSLIQATSFAVLPLAALITLPYGWVYAFYQTCLPAGFPADKGLKTSVSETFRTAALFPRQNHMVMAILMIFKLFVMLNIGICLYTLPQLAKSLLGIETAVTTGGFNPLNSTFLLTVICLTYLCVDPLVKTVYTLRYYYGLSEKSGEDLAAGLKRLASALPMMVLVFLAVVSVTSETARAEEVSGPVLAEGRPIEPEHLGHSIEQVLKRRDFAWRMPREEEVQGDQESGMIASMLSWIGDRLKSVGKTLGEWIGAIVEWFEKWFPKHDSQQTDQEKSPVSTAVRYLVYALIALSVFLMVVFIIRYLRKKRKTPEPETSVESRPVDLTDEQTLADELPSDSWRDLAGTLLDQGDFRLALRAMYLGSLARLSEQGLITVAAYKSNREYRDELARRAHEKKELIRLFSSSVTTFEGIWYGMHDLCRDDVLAFAENQERIGDHAI